jgi:2-polyprenyl-3-methyl-5-hydroxy-6-metoxy-1,4-benzoquinol methylase
MAFSRFDGKKIPNDIAEYDLIYMIDVYHHVPVDVREKMLKQIYDKMKPGAKLMLKDINGSSPFVLLNKMHDVVFAGEYGHEIGHKKALKLIESLGFKILETRKKQVLIYPHYFILAQK